MLIPPFNNFLISAERAQENKDQFQGRSESPSKLAGNSAVLHPQTPAMPFNPNDPMLVSPKPKSTPKSKKSDVPKVKVKGPLEGSPNPKKAAKQKAEPMVISDPNTPVSQVPGGTVTPQKITIKPPKPLKPEKKIGKSPFSKSFMRFRLFSLGFSSFSRQKYFLESASPPHQNPIGGKNDFKAILGFGGG